MESLVPNRETCEKLQSYFWDTYLYSFKKAITGYGVATSIHINELSKKEWFDSTKVLLAPTAQEISDNLPRYINSNYYLEIHKTNNGYEVGYVYDSDIEINAFDECSMEFFESYNLAQALAELLLWVKEQEKK